MNISIKSLIKFSLLTFVLVSGCIFPLFADDIQTFFDVRLMDNPANDGDSLHVDAAGKHIHVRLYFVDCPEIPIGSKSDRCAALTRTNTLFWTIKCRSCHLFWQRSEKVC